MTLVIPHSACDTCPVPPGIRNPAYEQCSLTYTLREMRKFSKETAGVFPKFQTGGLGQSMKPDVYESWLCLRHPCAAHYQDKRFCWVLNESVAYPYEKAPEQWIPWGPNALLNLCLKNVSTPLAPSFGYLNSDDSDECIDEVEWNMFIGDFSNRLRSEFSPQKISKLYDDLYKLVVGITPDDGSCDQQISRADFDGYFGVTNSYGGDAGTGNCTACFACPAAISSFTDTIVSDMMTGFTV